LRGVGDASYSLYLWHWPLLMEATRRWGASVDVIASALVVTGACTVGSYLAFERPFINARRARTAEDRPTSAAGRPVAAPR
jgi:peptidoglycan/LPS O-acetylase OafA/YrhL